MKPMFPALFILSTAWTLTHCMDEPEPLPAPEPEPPLLSSEPPCDVRYVVQQHCSQCHGESPRFGAQMPLVTTDHWRAPAVTVPDEPVHHLARERINYAFNGLSPQHSAPGPMPPAPNPRLTARERALLNNWIDAGVPGGDASVECQDYVPPPDPADYVCEGKELTLRAHAAGDADTPYKVGVADDAYISFSFRVPWGQKVYGKQFRAIIDNDDALHHWLLYEESGEPDGHLGVRRGSHQGGQLVHGWAPGQQPRSYGAGTGMSLAPGFYTLEMHYNSVDPEALDQSGVKICYVEDPPEHVAEMSTLGTPFFYNVDQVTSVCRPTHTEPLHIISVSPHMHLKGRHLKAIINRVDGSSEILHDDAFSFDTQVSYPMDVIINPGDTITTTCYWEGNATMGRGTTDEMCFLFTVAWPGGALSDSPGGGESCMGGFPGASDSSTWWWR